VCHFCRELRSTLDECGWIMKRILSQLGVVTIVTMILVSCSAGCAEDRNKLFREKLPNLDFGNELSIYVTIIDDYPEVDLFVRNETRDYILFDPGLGIRGFVFDETSCDWREIENNTTFHPDERFALGPVDDEAHNSYPTHFNPLDPHIVPKEGYRIVISGIRMESGIATSEMVASYIDIKE
jgi:hypothetical protein